MSNTVTEFIKRISTDNSFREFAQSQPDTALSSYSMTTDEQRAVKSLLEKPEGTDFGTKAGNGFWC